MVTVFWTLAALTVGLFIGGLIMALAFASHNSDGDDKVLAIIDAKDAEIESLMQDLSDAQRDVTFYQELYNAQMARQKAEP